MYRRLYLKLALIIFLVVFFVPLVWPYKDTPVVQKTVRDTYVNDRLQLDKREVLASRVLSWPAYLTMFAHSREERELRVAEVEDLGARVIKTREIQIVSKGLNLGLDLSGGSEIRYRLAGVAQDQRAETAQEVVRIIRRRIDAYGLREPVIAAQGANRILVQLPGQDRADIARIKSIIEGTGNLEFRLVAPANAPAYKEWEREGRGAPPDGYHVYTMEGSTEVLLISDERKFSGTDIVDARVGPGRMGEPVVNLQFSPQGQFRFAEVTGENIGERLAIILNDVRGPDGSIIEKGKLYSAPVIRSRIFGDAVIEGRFTREEAEDLRTTLLAGALPAKLIVEQEYTVGPTLGQDTIRGGLLAVQVGLVLVLVFMAVYYFACGLVANAALLMNLLIIVAILAAFRATLTLPGLAGLILTAGMAVDANVLIFERMREEQVKKRDKPLLTVLRDGYGRAFWTIFDANLTTVITALILWWWGSGPIKGFGITLTIGILSSMFTALVVTRVILELLVLKKRVRRFRMLRVIGETDFSFLRVAPYAMAVSAVVIVAGIVGFFMRGADKYGIDFSGGTVVQMALRQPVRIDEVKARIGHVGSDVVVQRLARPGEVITDLAAARDYSVRSQYIPKIQWGRIERLPVDYPRPEFAAGSLIEVSIDRPVHLGDLSRRLRETYSDAEVTGQGEPVESERFSRLVVLSRTQDLEPLRATVEQELNEQSLTHELRRAMGDLLMPDVFGALERRDGAAVAVMNLSQPLSAEQVAQRMTERGFAVTVEPVESFEGVFSFRVTAADLDVAALESALLQEFQGEVSDPFPQVEQVGPAIARGIRTAAIALTVMAWAAMICYIWFRFHELRWGVAGVVALVHDVLVTVGFLALTGRALSMPVVAAILTITGYSINDTIVIFDRIRENRRLRREPLPRLVDVSINQTLSRTVLTSGTTLLVLIALFIFGGSSIRDFTLAMIVGVISGTYSTVFIAAPILGFGRQPAAGKERVTVASAATA